MTLEILVRGDEMAQSLKINAEFLVLCMRDWTVGFHIQLTKRGFNSSIVGLHSAFLMKFRKHTKLVPI